VPSAYRLRWAADPAETLSLIHSPHYQKEKPPDIRAAQSSSVMFANLGTVHGFAQIDFWFPAMGASDPRIPFRAERSVESLRPIGSESMNLGNRVERCVPGPQRVASCRDTGDGSRCPRSMDASVCRSSRRATERDACLEGEARSGEAMTQHRILCSCYHQQGLPNLLPLAVVVEGSMAPTRDDPMQPFEVSAKRAEHTSVPRQSCVD
jgi:hypothetical protein